MEHNNYNISLEILGCLMKKERHIRELSRVLEKNHMTVKRAAEDLVKNKILDFEYFGKNKVFSLKKNIESRSKILEYEIYKQTKIISEYPILRKIFDEIIKNKEKFYIVTPNPEIVLMATKDWLLKKAILRSTFSVPDGIGLKFAFKFLNNENIEVIKGRELFLDILKMSKKQVFKTLVEIFPFIYIVDSNILPVATKLPLLVIEIQRYRKQSFEIGNRSGREVRAFINVFGRTRADRDDIAGFIADYFGNSLSIKTYTQAVPAGTEVEKALVGDRIDVESMTISGPVEGRDEVEFGGSIIAWARVTLDIDTKL